MTAFNSTCCSTQSPLCTHPSVTVSTCVCFINASGSTCSLFIWLKTNPGYCRALQLILDQSFFSPRLTANQSWWAQSTKSNLLMTGKTHKILPTLVSSNQFCHVKDRNRAWLFEAIFFTWKTLFDYIQKEEHSK